LTSGARQPTTADGDRVTTQTAGPAATPAESR
jgi:hypothetical protein